jgi:starch phosphorylase
VRNSERRDHFLLLADYASYIACQERVDMLYRNEDEWVRRAILNVAGTGKFSSDQAILNYPGAVWNIKPARPDTNARISASRSECR